eukprot:TRINITY_DN10919_c0_g2_i1.p1 TRINITY_DN10919_c0_g2~~TRINITY_DN10919_c0_g2_i1.p1  ORF type:complete len:546 (+),score=106.94 TRINITY_DN10919_c0_g2_i1:159-1640(+)
MVAALGLVMVSRAIVGPFSLVREVMLEVACMQTDAGVGPPSAWVTELRVIERAALFLVANMRAFRGFVQQSALAVGDDATVAEADNELDPWEDGSESADKYYSSSDGSSTATSKSGKSTFAVNPLSNTPSVAALSPGDSILFRETPELEVSPGEPTACNANNLGVFPVFTLSTAASRARKRRRKSQASSYSGSFLSGRRSSCFSDKVVRDKSDVLTRGLSCHLHLKPFSLCMLNLRGFHRRIADMEGPQVLNLSGLVVGAVLAEVRTHDGVLETFSGDHFTVSFGGIRAARQHRIAAPAAALGMRGALCAMDLPSTAAAVSGQGFLGNVGAGGARKYMFISPANGFCAALLRHAAGLGVSVLCPARERAVTSSFDVRLVGWVLFAPCGGSALSVCEVLGPQSAATAPLPADGNVPGGLSGLMAWNAWAVRVGAGEWERAKDIAAEAAKYDHTSVVYRHFRHALDSKGGLLVDLASPYKYAFGSYAPRERVTNL